MSNDNELVVDAGFRERMNEYRQPPAGDVGLLEACSQNPVLFVERMIGIRPYAWQVRFLIDMQRIMEGESEHRRIVANTSRQVGKSASLAWFALWATVFNKRPSKDMGNTRVAIISRSDDQAKKLLRDIRMWYRHGDRFMRRKYTGEDGEPLFGRKTSTGYEGFFELLLSSSSPNNTTMISWESYEPETHGEHVLAGAETSPWIGCFPPTAKVLGNTFTIGMIDEAGHETMDDEFLIRELWPAGNANDALWIGTSTPWKNSGWFYDQCHDETGAVKVLTVTIDALKDEPAGASQYEAAQKDIEEWMRQGKVTDVKMVFYCKFMQGEIAYFDPNKVLEAFNEEQEAVDSYPGPCDLGVDFGAQKTSKTVLTISKYDPEDKMITRLWHRVYPTGTDLHLIDDIKELRERFNIQRIIPDECPAGAFDIERMKNEGWEVHPMNFRREKVKKYNAFRRALNLGQVESYEDDLLRDEMLALEKSQSRVQSLITPPKGGSDDLVDSFVMSAYFMVEDESAFNFYDWSEVDDIDIEW